jgi:cyclase
MLRTRLIPALLVNSHLELVKTISFSSRNYLGDPLNASYIFSGFDVDELLVLDIDASPENRAIPDQFVSALALYTTVPLTIGGGINSLDQIQGLLARGVEKVVLSSVLKRDLYFLKQAVDRFGSSSISVILNTRCDDCGQYQAWFGKPDSKPGLPLLSLAQQCEQTGAGELIINCIDLDGTRDGFDIDLFTQLNNLLTIPLVALGGCGTTDHIAQLLNKTPISGVAAGSYFVYAPFTNQVLLNYPFTPYSRI